MAQAELPRCNSLEKLPKLVGLSNSITNASSAFSGCLKIPEVPLFDTSNVTAIVSMLSGCREITKIPDYNLSSVTGNVNYFARNTYKVKEGILETYNKFLDRGESITSHIEAFLDCGRDTPEGQIALSQIPESWGGRAEG